MRPMSWPSVRSENCVAQCVVLATLRRIDVAAERAFNGSIVAGNILDFDIVAASAQSEIPTDCVNPNVAVFRFHANVRAGTVNRGVAIFRSARRCFRKLPKR